jgi:hypothetical protein
MNTLALIAELDRALDGPIQWVEDRVAMKEHGAVAYTGRAIQNDGGGWLFTLVEFPVEGTRTAVTGTAMTLGTIVKLTPELATKALQRAKTRTRTDNK